MSDEPTVSGLLHEQVMKVEQGLADHVKHCARLQRGALAVGCVTLGLVATDSPKLGRVAEKVLSLLVF